MSTEALIFMIVVESVVTIITVYLFVRVLRSPGGSGDDEEEEK